MSLDQATETMARVERIRRDFPILQRQIQGKPLVYLDNAASSQKPESVIRAMDDYYRQTNANVHRGVHTLSEEATTLYENARLRLARFINAPSDKQVIFTRTTDQLRQVGSDRYARFDLELNPILGYGIERRTRGAFGRTVDHFRINTGLHGLQDVTSSQVDGCRLTKFEVDHL